MDSVVIQRSFYLLIGSKRNTFDVHDFYFVVLIELVELWSGMQSDLF